ncbi:MAG: CDP-diacylglycerol--glycerol-3-phosphate 3-phosphatidyltransferase, partial [Microbacterium gubbeenense]
HTHDVAAAWLGKVKTAVQGVVLGWALLPLGLLIGATAWTTVTAVGLWIVVVLTVVSGIDYVIAQARGSRAR